MKRYSEYKDSGVKWIGEIPGHWKKNKIMRLFTHIGSGTTPKGDQYYTDESNGIPWINSGDLNYGFLTKCNKYITEKALNDISTLKKYPINTLMIAMYGASIGKYAISHIEGCTNQACCALYGIKDELNLTYASYLMGPCKQKWIEESFGGTQPNISAEKIKQTWLPLPPLPEQEAIVTYLDSKVAKIDEYISIAEKKIAALEELKQTIIAEAVTRGIHKDVPMKDSGVKWIGMIPEHWKVLCLKYLSKIKGRIGYRGYTAADLVSEGEGAFVIGGKHINQCILNTESPDYISWDKYYESPEIMVSKGDIVMAQRGSLGKVALIDKEINEATINPSLVLIKDICCDASFLYFYLRSNSTLTLIELLNTATAVPMISQKQIEKMPIPLPPLPEQQEIVTYIEAKAAKIDQLCQAERSQIEKLKEYKQRLISDVVTGKVKVTND